MSYSVFAAQHLLHWLKGAPFPAPPESLWLSLHGSLLDAQGRDELTQALFGSPSRLRCPTDLWGAVEGPDAEGACWVANTRDIILGRCRCSEPLPLHGIGLWDAEIGGQLILRGTVLRDPNSLQQPTAVPGVVVLFGASRLKLRLQ